MKPREIGRMASNIIGKSGKSQPEEVGEDEQDKGDFEGMSIDHADNGFSITTRHKQPAAKKGEPQPYNEGKRHVFAHDHPVAQHIHAILKHTK